MPWYIKRLSHVCLFLWVLFPLTTVKKWFSYSWLIFFQVRFQILIIMKKNEIPTSIFCASFTLYYCLKNNLVVFLKLGFFSMHLWINSILRRADLLKLSGSFGISCMRKGRWYERSVLQVDFPQVFIIPELRMNRGRNHWIPAQCFVQNKHEFSFLFLPPDKQESTI